jgi:hypothetical protein
MRSRWLGRYVLGVRVVRAADGITGIQGRRTGRATCQGADVFSAREVTTASQGCTVTWRSHYSGGVGWQRCQSRQPMGWNESGGCRRGGTYKTSTPLQLKEACKLLISKCFAKVGLPAEALGRLLTARLRSLRELRRASFA